MIPSKAESEAARILLDLWDPLYIADIDVHPEQEYLHEARIIIALLADGGGEAAIVQTLERARDDLHQVHNAQTDRETARKLYEW